MLLSKLKKLHSWNKDEMVVTDGNVHVLTDGLPWHDVGLLKLPLQRKSLSHEFVRTVNTFGK
jgi:hypothetical protein